MAIYFGGTLGGSVAGWLAIKHTFFAGPAERESSVSIFGARAPLAAVREALYHAWNDPTFKGEPDFRWRRTSFLGQAVSPDPGTPVPP